MVSLSDRLTDTKMFGQHASDPLKQSASWLLRTENHQMNVEVAVQQQAFGEYTHTHDALENSRWWWMHRLLLTALPATNYCFGDLLIYHAGVFVS